jgi:signal recognition particle subunit SEC65
MVSKNERTLVIWPEYFDSNRSYKDGRRVPVAAAVSNPQLDEVSKVLTQLDIKHKVDAKAAYPATWSKKGGRILIPKTQAKSKIIKWVAKRLKQNRQQASS